MAVAMIADAHLSGPGGNAEALVEQLERLPEQGCEHLLLLGDLFHAWVGLPSFATPDIELFVDALRWLRDRGIPTDYIEGNRDFFLASSPWADALRSVGQELALTVDGVRYLAVHGDGLDPRDWKYRFWRRASKSLPSKWLLSSVPRRFAHHLVNSTEERLSRTNRDHKRHIPEGVIRCFAEDRLADGHDVLLLGHFHEEHHWPVDGGRVWMVDAWFRSRRIEWLGTRDPGRRTGA